MSYSTAPVSFDSLPFLEELYLAWKRSPGDVDTELAAYFAQLEAERPLARLASSPERDDAKALRLFELVEAYRTFGHRDAALDPLSGPPPLRPEMQPQAFGFTDADLDRTFDVAGLFGQQKATLREVLEKLRNTYCRYIGVEFMHIDAPEIRRWLSDRMESTQNRVTLSREQQLRMLTLLTKAETFEHFLQAKFLGAKRFSLEGGETLIPLMDQIIDESSAAGVTDIVIGMAHRGRLNVLANVIGKPPSAIFREFNELDHERMLGKGDVKYHLGFSADRVSTSGNQVHLSLAFNPSHLEAIYPVVEGRVRAKQDRLSKGDRQKGLALVIHGDASFAAQGIVAECLNFSELPGYTTGGTLHVIVNNQVGFTTPPEQGRSTAYCTNVARMLDVPIFHVNGEDPESVAQVVRLAVEFRHTFNKDVVIDMYCYRKWGHNEGDEPRFTQPEMYAKIDKRAGVRAEYLGHLVDTGLITEADAKEIQDEVRAHLDAELARSPDLVDNSNSMLTELWKRYSGGKDADCPEVPTGVAKETLVDVGRRMITPPEGFEPHPKLVRGVLKDRLDMLEGRRPVDWAFAEMLAFGTLVNEGNRVRLSGQDVCRGTFSSRHSVMYDHRNENAWVPPLSVAREESAFEVRNSPLSEFGVLGFEYGYSLDRPDALVIWEAQFGDFANGGQVILDQFLSSAEDKWQRLSGLVLLLPHGFEGQGPEHSSARLERFLTMSAEDNWQVCNLTTAAQIFHALRRQVVRPWRKPLVVMTPKSGLRTYTSSIDELVSGSFQKLIGDAEVDPNNVTRVLLCSGKVYYDLVKERAARKLEDVAIVRLEQIYPYPAQELADELDRYPNLTKLTWVQEEPWNMGAWFYLRAREHASRKALPVPLECVSRPESASPATGSHSAHKIEQRTLIEQAFQSDADGLRAAR